MVAEVMYVPGVAREPHFPESVRRNVPRSSLHPQSGRAAVVVVVVVVSDVVVFDAAGSYIMNKESGEVNMLREEDGNYMLDIWVPPVADDTSGFHRQP